ncbi:MAG: hypothetical protein P8Y44_12490, partial [Acidobacteriota bacterium]
MDGKGLRTLLSLIMSRTGWPIALGLLTLIVAGPWRLEAQSFAGETIREIRVEGAETLTEETVLYYLGLEVDSRFDPGDVNERIHELWDRQMNDDIRLDIEPVTDGIR